MGNLDLPDRKIIAEVVEQHRKQHGAWSGDWQESDMVVRKLEEMGFQEMGGTSLAKKVEQVADCLERRGDVESAQEMRRGFLRRNRY